MIMQTPRTVSRALVAALLLTLWAAATQAGESVRIVAASDLRFAMDIIIEEYEATHPDDAIEVIYGSSGRFHAQIVNGAPFDLYFSADVAYPLDLVERGLVHGDMVPYALGRLVLWSNTVDASELTLKDLSRSEFRRIAIANPRHAPYGVRAQEALRSVGLWDELEPRLVLGENIAHTMQLVQSGAAEIGIIALALARNPAIREQGGYHLIDAERHQPLEQGYIITRRAADNAAAQRFADHMGREQSRAVMREYGFVLPGE